ncbi:MAG: carbohydrate ABC transporter permease, partial [Chloroflexi bacterium]|nr:carbohydrate ABC transporter permease [Chloroflexota bacterium]
RTLGWLDTFKPLMVPAWTGAAYNIFLFRQFFLSIPAELEDAARIDGCSDLGFYVRILMPLSWPAIATVAIFSFRWNWQNFMGPLIYLTSHKRFTLALGLGMFRSQFGTRWNELMAVSLLIMIPPLVLFFVAQRWFIQGIVFTGIKG